LFLILVGAGGISRDLVRRLGERWSITVIDKSPDLLRQIAKERELTTVEGDGSSRLVLEEAGIRDAAALVAATNRDDVNLEVCRLALEAGVQRLSAVCVEPERQGEYRERNLPLIVPDCLAARRIDLQLETRRIASMAFADGRAEAIEFLVSEDSPVRGKTLAELHSHTWILGALLREGELIIPHGATRLEAGDRVTVVGASSDFSTIVNTFTAGMRRFPESFGQRIAVAVERPEDLEGYFKEAIYLARNSKATSVVLLHQDPKTVADEERSAAAASLLVQAIEASEGAQLKPQPVPGRPASFLAGLAKEGGIGLLVVPAPVERGLAGWWRARRILRLLRRTGKPVLLARGRFPYGRILLPVRKTTAGTTAARAAIDLARFTQAPLVGLAVVDPAFLAGPDAEVEARYALTCLEDDAAIHDVVVEEIILRGNPVRIFQDRSLENDLVVLPVHEKSRRLGPRLVVAGMLARMNQGSILLVPAQDPD